MAANQAYLLPAVVDWTSGARAKLLASVSQVCNLAIRHCRRHASKAAFRGGKGKLAATKELNTSGAAGSAANQQWRGQRAIAGLAVEPPKSSRLFQLPAPFGAPFAALPFLNSQELLAAVGRELNLPTDDSLLAPIAALEAPSFAAAPAFQAPAPDGTDGSHNAVGRTAEAVPAPRDPRKAHSPLARYALLPASRPGTGSQVSHQQQQSSRQLMSALHDWARLFAPEHSGSSCGGHSVAFGGSRGSSRHSSGSSGGSPMKHAVKPAAHAVANEKLRGALLQYARLGR